MQFKLFFFVIFNQDFDEKSRNGGKFKIKH